jgi:outer membrane immunogenic protein
MQKLLIATLSISALTIATANAADLAVRPRAVAAAPACAAHQFRGGYIGINGGAVNYEADRADRDGNFDLGNADTVVSKKWGGMVGGQIGYNWTTCNTLWGIEVDGDWASAKATHQWFPNVAGNNSSVESRFDGIVTARARTGVVLDSLALYLTGGVAAVHTRTTWNTVFSAPFAALTQTAEVRDWRLGWVAGFGTEWAWSDRVSVRSEVLYVGVADREDTLTVARTVGASFPGGFTRSDSMWITRIGLNYRFGGDSVVARY